MEDENRSLTAQVAELRSETEKLREMVTHAAKIDHLEGALDANFARLDASLNALVRASDQHRHDGVGRVVGLDDTAPSGG